MSLSKKIINFLFLSFFFSFFFSCSNGTERLSALEDWKKSQNISQNNFSYTSGKYEDFDDFDDFVPDSYLKFESDKQFTLKANNGITWDGRIEYSTDLQNWNTWNAYQISSELSDSRYRLYLRGINNTVITSVGLGLYGGEADRHYWVITGNGAVRCTGDIRSLLNYNDIENVTMGIKCFSYLFANCENLITPPVLPSLKLNTGCYSYMFSGCSSLKNAPELPASKLDNYCYMGMFSGCSSLTSAPELPASDLTYSCYESMFSGCSSLTSAPELSSTNLNYACYMSMFEGCSSLENAPVLPALNLVNDCYSSMFMGCRSLKQAPLLPSTIMATSCYRSMFSGCISLKSAPVLSARNLELSCYESMFSNCTSLKAAPELPATALASSCYRLMFSGCTALEDATSLPATILSNYCYNSMFEGCSSLTKAPSIDAMNLAESCCDYMFSGCSSLEVAPELTAIYLAKYCYRGMFKDCSKLKNSPNLPATDLVENCYEGMFEGCTSLEDAVELNITSSAKDCAYQMFKDCKNIKVLVLPEGNIAEEDLKNNFKDMYDGCFYDYSCSPFDRTSTSYIPEELKSLDSVYLCLLPFEQTYETRVSLLSILGPILDFTKIESGEIRCYMYISKEVKNYSKKVSTGSVYDLSKVQNSVYFISDGPFNVTVNRKNWDGKICIHIPSPNGGFDIDEDWKGDVVSARRLNAANQDMYFVAFRGKGNTRIDSTFKFLSPSNQTLKNIVYGNGKISKLLDENYDVNKRPGDNAFRALFKDCIQIYSSPELDLNNLSVSCYESLFENSGLRVQPVFSTSINSVDANTFKYLFYNCGAEKLHYAANKSYNDYLKGVNDQIKQIYQEMYPNMTFNAIPRGDYDEIREYLGLMYPSMELPDYLMVNGLTVEECGACQAYFVKTGESPCIGYKGAGDTPIGYGFRGLLKERYQGKGRQAKK